MAVDENVKRIILRYFQSWQEPADYAEFRACLADNVVFDSTFGVVSGADALTELARRSESPWGEITLLGSNFDENSGALFYNGTDKATGDKTRVGEHLKICDGRICRITTVICQVEKLV